MVWHRLMNRNVENPSICSIGNVMVEWPLIGHVQTFAALGLKHLIKIIFIKNRKKNSEHFNLQFFSFWKMSIVNNGSRFDCITRCVFSIVIILVRKLTIFNDCLKSARFGKRTIHRTPNHHFSVGKTEIEDEIRKTLFGLSIEWCVFFFGFMILLSAWMAWS